jgi:hypothetical protein
LSLNARFTPVTARNEVATKGFELALREVSSESAVVRG